MSYKNGIKSYLTIGLGCFIITISMNFFLIPYKLAPEEFQVCQQFSIMFLTVIFRLVH